MKSKNLGIKFGPRDLTVDQVNAFTIIQDKIEKLEETKHKKKDGKRN